MKAHNPPDVEVGQVWRLPDRLVRYPGGKPRYCLVVAIETAVSGDPVRAYVVPGSSHRGGNPRIVVAAEQAGTPLETCFRFFFAPAVNISDLIVCQHVGDLPAERLAEISDCIHRSRLHVLKRIAKG